MTRRAGGDSAQNAVSLFPFLAVLLCTMGSLILLLIVIARQARDQRDDAHNGNAPGVDAAAVAERREDLDWEIRQLHESHRRTAEQLAEQRSALSHLEEHSQRLRGEIEELVNAERLLSEQKNLDESERAKLLAEIEELRRKAAEVEAKLAEEKAKGRRPPTFAVIPYDGENGTRRRPIYVECRGDAVVLQPEGIVFHESDFAGSLGPSNPLAACLRVTAEHYSRLAHLQATEQPYPLLLVRPDGIGAYYAARAAMSTWDSDFGYELIDADWPLEFPPADAELAQLLARTVDEARVRQAMIARAAPSLRTSRQRPFQTASSGGGDGDGSAAGTGGRYGEITAADANGRGGPGGLNQNNGPGGNGNGLAGTSSGAAADGSLAGGPGSGAMGANGPGGGLGGGSYGVGGPGGNGAVNGSPYGGSGIGAAGDPNGVAGANGTGGPNGGGGPNAKGVPGGVGSEGLAAADPSGVGGGSGSGSGYGTGNGSGTSGQTTNGNNGGNPSGASGGPQLIAADQASGGGSAGGAAAGGASGSGGPGGSMSGGMAGQPGDPNGAMSASSGSAGAMGGTQGGGAEGMSGDPSGAQGGGMPSISIGSPPTDTLANLNQPSRRSVESLADKRGKNWGLPESSQKATGVTRPVQIYCSSDRLTVLSDRGVPDRQINLGPHTEDSIDELVSTVRSQIYSWGMAGRNMYWKPVLSMHVAPDGAERFQELKVLLAGSGLEVTGKAIAVSNSTATTARRP